MFVFLFHLKRLFLYEVLNFRSDFFLHGGNRLNKKVKVNFKIYDVQAGKQIIEMHIFPNISRRKGNQQGN